MSDFPPKPIKPTTREQHWHANQGAFSRGNRFIQSPGTVGLQYTRHGIAINKPQRFGGGGSTIRRCAVMALYNEYLGCSVIGVDGSVSPTVFYVAKDYAFRVSSWGLISSQQAALVLTYQANGTNARTARYEYSHGFTFIREHLEPGYSIYQGSELGVIYAAIGVPTGVLVDPNDLDSEQIMAIEISPTRRWIEDKNPFCVNDGGTRRTSLVAGTSPFDTA